MTENHDKRINELGGLIDGIGKQVAELWETARPIRAELAALKAEVKKAEAAKKDAERRVKNPRKAEVLDMFENMSFEEQAIWLLARGKQASFYYRWARYREKAEAVEAYVNAIARNGHTDPQIHAAALLMTSELPEVVDLRMFDPETAKRIVNRYRHWGIKINMQEAA